MTAGARRTLIRLAAALAFVLLLVWLMSALESVTTMLMVAFFLAYLLNPAADRLERWRVPRPIGSLLLIVVMLLAVVLLFMFLVPSVVREVTDFAARAPKYAAVLSERLVAALQQYQLQHPEEWERAAAWVYQQAQQLLPEVRRLADPLARFVGTVFKSTLGIVATLVYLLLLPVLAYYLLVSFPHIRDAATDLIPPYARDAILGKFREIDLVLSGFVRGQVTICCILAVLYSLGFVVIRIDLAIVLGVSAGLLFIIPYVGTMVGLVGGSLMALAQYGDVRHVLYVVGWIALVQTFEGYVLTPRIVGQAVGLHPVAYILALIIGANLFGFVGMLVAIPAAAVLKVLLKSGVELYRRSDVYQDRRIEGDDA